MSFLGVKEFIIYIEYRNGLYLVFNFPPFRILYKNECGLKADYLIQIMSRVSQSL